MKPHTLILAVAAAAASVAQGAARQTPVAVYDRHVIFDGEPNAASLPRSGASHIAPSGLDATDGRIPIEAGRWVVPGGSLRLSWMSATGGDWEASVKVRSLYTLGNAFDGDALSLWVYSEDGLDPQEAPRIRLEDKAGNETFAVNLLEGRGALPKATWTRIVIPVTGFKAIYRSTDELRFDIAALSHITFGQGLDDGRSHTLLVDDIEVVRAQAAAAAPQAPPTSLSSEAGERHVDLAWLAPAGPEPLRYTIYRSWDGSRFEPVGSQPGNVTRFADFVGPPPRNATYRVTATSLGGAESAPTGPVSAATHAFSDDELLSMVQKGCFRYYWENGHPNAGMALEVTPGDPNLVALGASGFGIMAIVVGAERGFVAREQAANRLVRIVRFLDKADRFHGVWPHFLDGRTGHVIALFGPYDDGGDLVETAFLTQGLLTARAYFSGDTPAEREIRETVTRLWEGIEWDWYRKDPRGDFLYWHWSPDHAWHISHPLVGWNETMIIYLLAIASPTHPVPASMYYSGWAGQSETAVEYRRGWSRTTMGDHYANGHEYFGIRLNVGEGTGGDLFFTQFSFLGFDPRGRRDKFTNYFENNRALALINRAYCMANPGHYAGYGPDCWGLSAGINAGGGMPEPAADNGTICISAALGEFPYTPKESMAALKHFYRDLGPKAWGIYGFHDGFNETQDWFAPVWMGLNQAQIVVMIENYRSALAWRMFMSNPEIPRALDAIGFSADPAARP